MKYATNTQNHCRHLSDLVYFLGQDPDDLFLQRQVALQRHSLDGAVDAMLGALQRDAPAAALGDAT